MSLSNPSIVQLGFMLAAVFTASSAAVAADADTPNFIIINIDDMGYADIGPHGSTHNRTPNLDRMAKADRLLT